MAAKGHLEMLWFVVKMTADFQKNNLLKWIMLSSRIQILCHKHYNNSSVQPMAAILEKSGHNENI